MSQGSLAPEGRRSHGMLAMGGKLIVFGGFNQKKYKHYNDLWEFDPRTNLWRCLFQLGNQPRPRRRFTFLEVSPGRIILHGGTSPDGAMEGAEPEYENEDDDLPISTLLDHNDTFELRLAITLKSYCLMKVVQYKLPTTELPFDLVKEIEYLSKPNDISEEF